MGSGVKTIHSDDPQDFETNIRVLAGPGAGKTYWLVGQLRQILRHSLRLSKNRKVAVITYTNKATENICKQIQFGMDRIEVSTIHAFLYANVIKPYFHLIADEYEFDINQLDGHDDTIFTGHEFINSVIGIANKGWVFDSLSKKNKSLDYHETGRFISRFRWHYDGKNIILKQQGASYKLYNAFDNDFVNVYKHEVWKQKSMMHDDDVLYFAYQLFTNTKTQRIKRLIANKFPYILIDEYQDTSSIQHFLIQELATAGCFVTIIGDAAQSIYSFANGDIDYIKNIKLHDVVDYTIEDNRRSTIEVVDFLNVIRTDIVQRSVRNVHSMKPMIVVGDAIENYNRCKASFVDDNGNAEMLYTLSRNNLIANDMKAKLGASFTKTKLLDDLLELSDYKRSRKFVACINAVENARLIIMNEAIKELSKAFGLNLKVISDKKKVVRFLNILCSHYEDYSKSDGKALLTLIISKLDNSISKVKSGKPKELFSHPYTEYSREIKFKDDFSTDITIHKAKGLEFRNVFVVMEDEQTAVDFLMSNDLDLNTQEAEEHRIYYVACSRAENRLFISVPSLSEDNRQKILDRFGDVIDTE